MIVHVCDMCGSEGTPVEYRVTLDGREFVVKVLGAPVANELCPECLVRVVTSWLKAERLRVPYGMTVRDVAQALASAASADPQARIICAG